MTPRFVRACASSRRKAVASAIAASSSCSAARVRGRELLAIWMDDYNTIRPHSAIGNVPPAVYANLSAPWMQRDGAPELSWGSAPRPFASPSQQGSNEERILLASGG